MLSCQAIFDLLRAEGVGFFAGVPDSLLKSFCAYVTDAAPPERHVITANEGSAIALAAGHHFATGELPLCYMQNSGLGNAVNPLASLADPQVYGVPMLVMIGWRGEPGKKDEPQHVKMGAVTLESLAALGVTSAVLSSDPDEAAEQLRGACAVARADNAPYAIVVAKGTFDAYELQSVREDRYSMKREEAIDVVLGHLPQGAAIVATTGMPARELFELRARRGESHDSDFLTVGSMGHASQIALGMALAQGERPIVCLDGDGAAIMHLGGLTTIGALAPKNLLHIVLNNAAHDSVGGQPTVAYDVDLCAIARGCGYAYSESVDSAGELVSAMKIVADVPGPRFLEIRVSKGARGDLGRPTRSPAETKTALMRFLAAPGDG